MNRLCATSQEFGGSAPATPGFNAFGQEWTPEPTTKDRWAAPFIPAAESALRSHPCVALSSAQVIPEWTYQPVADNVSTLNGDHPLNFVSHSRGSLQSGVAPGGCPKPKATGWLRY